MLFGSLEREAKRHDDTYLSPSPLLFQLNLSLWSPNHRTDRKITVSLNGGEKKKKKSCNSRRGDNFLSLLRFELAQENLKDLTPSLAAGNKTRRRRKGHTVYTQCRQWLIKRPNMHIWGRERQSPKTQVNNNAARWEVRDSAACFLIEQIILKWKDWRILRRISS